MVSLKKQLGGQCSIYDEFDDGRKRRLPKVWHKRSPSIEDYMNCFSNELESFEDQSSLLEKEKCAKAQLTINQFLDNSQLDSDDGLDLMKFAETTPKHQRDCSLFREDIELDQD